MNKPYVSVLQAATRLIASARSARLFLAAGLLAPLAVAGCSKVQVQFYTPPDTSVTVRRMGTGPAWQASDEPVARFFGGVFGSIGDLIMGSNTSTIAPENVSRLEKMPEMCAVYDLTPTGLFGGRSKTYRFKYSSADGLPEVSVYGEIDIWRVKSPEARKFVAHAFVPIALPSEYYSSAGLQLFPVRGPSGVGLSALELEHLRQGDMVRKVYFIADLQKAWETSRMIDDHIERLRSAETVLNTELELVDARFEAYRQDALYADPTDDPLAASEDRSGKSAQFVKLEALRQYLENVRFDIRHQVDDLTNEKRIRTRLLDSMKIVNRRGSLVLATPENQWEFHDAAEQVSNTRVYPGFTVGPKDAYCTGAIELPPLGELLAVVRVGGRHMQWGPPPAAEDGVAMNGSR